MSNFKLKQTGEQVQKAIDYAMQVPKLSEAIADETEARENAIADIKAQGLQQVPLNAEGKTVEEQLAWLAENGDINKTYLLVDNFLYQWRYSEREVSSGGGYKNWLPLATETYNGTKVYGENGYVIGYRLSSSGSVSEYDGMLATGFIPASDGARIRTEGFTAKQIPMAGYVISYNASGTKLKHHSWGSSATHVENDVYISDFTLDSDKYGTGIAFIRISASAQGSTLPKTVTVNEEIKESTTTIVKEYAWTNTGRDIVPSDNEDDIIKLNAEILSLKSKINDLNTGLDNASKNRLSVTEVFAPSPQLPADGSEGSDFNGDRDYITPEQIYAYIDALTSKYPRFLTKEVLGKDESGTHDWCRYVCGRRTYDAWLKPNYPAMYAWANGSTVIYSVSVSPRIGDTLYTTAYVGTSKGTVSAVSNANQTRTVGGVAYTRDKTKDVAPTLVYTETAYSPHFLGTYAGYKNGIYDGAKSKISTISSMSNGTLKGANGVTYTRYPLGDRDGNFEQIPAIVIGANEHGTGGDPAMPAIVSARMVKDLCECKNADNPFLNLLKNEYMMVFCPVIDPWGFSKNNKSYYNSNGVNIDRNFDTPGWGNDEANAGHEGDYGGSENETQYFMNTLVASGAKIAMANHSLGHGIDSSTGEAVSSGHCHWMLGRNNGKYTESLKSIAEVMTANYNLAFSDYGEAPPETWAKTRSYIDWIGAEGGAVEMQSRDGFVLDGEGQQFTARICEAGYTLLLQFLRMLIDKQDA